MVNRALVLGLLVFMTAGCGETSESSPAPTPPLTDAENSPSPPAAEPASPDNAKIEDPLDKTGKSEVHPAPKVATVVEKDENAFTCSGEEPQMKDPLPYIRTLKGSEIILTPKGPKPPWQMIFSKDYVAVQGTATWEEDGLLAICSGTDELILVDASDPTNPTLKGSLRPSAEIPALEPKKGIAFSVLGSPFGGKEAPNKYGRCEHIARSGNILYFSHRQDQFRHNGYVMAYDLSSTPPSRLHYRTRKGESYSGLSVNPTMVAVAAHTSGLLLLDKELEPLGSVEEIENAWDVILTEDSDRAVASGSRKARNLALVADGKNGVVVVDTSKPDSPRILSRLALPGFAKKLAWGKDPNHVFVALGPAGMAKISIKNKKRPRLLYRTDTPGTAVDIAVSGGAVAVADWTSVRLYDALTNKEPPALAIENTDEQMGRALSVAFRKDAIFVGDWTGVHILKPDLGAPVPVGEFDRAVGRVLPQTKGKPSLEVHVRNTGAAPLTIRGGGTRGKGFSANVPETILAPGEERSIQVDFSPAEKTEDQRGELVLCTDDPDAPSLTLPLKANPSSFGPGKGIPDIGLELTKGGNWSLSEHRGKPVLLAYFATF